MGADSQLASPRPQHPADKGRWRSIFVIVVIWVLALPLVAAQQTSSANDHLILAGERIGPAKLGANIKDGLVHAVLGPTSLFLEDRLDFFMWDSEDKARKGSFGVTTTPEFKILAIIVNGDPVYATPEGLHVGVPEKRVRDVLGEPSRTITTQGKGLSLQYSSGILFSVDYESGTDYRKVTQILIVSRNCFSNAPPDICTYLTGYH